MNRSLTPTGVTTCSVVTFSDGVLLGLDGVLLGLDGVLLGVRA